MDPFAGRPTLGAGQPPGCPHATLAPDAHVPATPSPAEPSAVAASTLPSLDAYLSSDSDLPSCVAATAAAIACADGDLTLAEYEAMTALVAAGGASPLFAVALFEAAERQLPLGTALDRLGAACAGLDPPARHAAWQLLLPLIELQRKGRLDIATRCARTIGVQLSEHERSQLAAGPEESALASAKAALRRLTRRDDGSTTAEAARALALCTGSQDLLSSWDAYRQGTLSAGHLGADVARVELDARRTVEDFAARLTAARVAAQAARSVSDAAQDLRHQVAQRLASVDARIAFELRTLAEDIDETVHDAGESFELTVIDRLGSDRWRDKGVWDSIAKSTFGKDMERRIDRLVRRREESLSLLKEDLRLFQQSLQYSRAQLVPVEHHAALAALMPTMRFRTRSLVAADSAANITLATGALGTVAAGGAAYVLGVAAVLPVVTAVAPFVGGAALVAGVFKWMTDSKGWKASEIKDKRRAFEQELRSRLQQAQESHREQLAAVAHEFGRTARITLTPIVLEADAAGRVLALQERLFDGLAKRYEAAVAQLPSDLRSKPDR